MPSSDVCQISPQDTDFGLHNVSSLWRRNYFWGFPSFLLHILVFFLLTWELKCINLRFSETLNFLILSGHWNGRVRKNKNCILMRMTFNDDDALFISVKVKSALKMILNFSDRKRLHCWNLHASCCGVSWKLSEKFAFKVKSHFGWGAKLGQSFWVH